MMFSMSSPAEQLPGSEKLSFLQAKSLASPRPPALALGIPTLDRALPDGGIPSGQVTEICVDAGQGGATSFALWACRAAQEEARQRGSEAWCAFLDPSGSLFVPGVLEARVDPKHLLVVRPPLATAKPTQRGVLDPWSRLHHLAVKLAEARVFEVLVIDMVGAVWSPRPHRTAPLAPVPLTHWGKTVRRLSLAVRGTTSRVLLLTDRAAVRSLPLPVALRLELQRRNATQWMLGVTKDAHGRIRPPTLISLEHEPRSLEESSASSGRHLSLVPGGV